jgi:hypothetical protein
MQNNDYDSLKYLNKSGRITNSIGTKEEQLVGNRETGNLKVAVISKKLHVICAENLKMLKNILSRVLVTIDGVSEWMVRFIAPYTFTTLETTGNPALSLIYTVDTSPLHTH